MLYIRLNRLLLDDGQKMPDTMISDILSVIFEELWTLYFSTVMTMMSFSLS